MNLIELIRSAFTSVCSNKMRSGLTMLGIIISVASVILIHVIGSSLNDTMADTFSEQKNANRCLLSVIPSHKNHTAVTDKDGNYIIPDSNRLTDKLIEQYCERFDGKVVPVYETGTYECTASTSTGSTSSTELKAVNDAYVSFFDNEIISGRFISDEDMKKKANTVVISDLTAKKCFGDDEAIGQYIYLRVKDGVETQFVVVGVYEYDNVTFMTEEEKSLIITPIYICYSKYLTENPDYIQSLDSQAFLLRNLPDVEEYRKESTAFFNEYFNDDKWEIEMYFMTDEISGIQKILKLLTRVMTIITIVSTLVGGLGIMNVMTVIANERIPEIGIKRAIGARTSVIISEFLIESTILSLISAVAGIILGLLLAVNFISIARIICNFSIKVVDVDVVFSPPFSIILYAMLSGVITGIIFGIYPALKASSISITDSIRHA